MIMMYKSSDFHFRIIMTDVTIHQHLPEMIYHPKCIAGEEFEKNGLDIP